MYTGSMDPLLRVTAVLETGALGWLDKLLIAVWRGSSYDGADAFYREMKAGVLRHGSGVGHLAVIEPNTPLPDAASRERIASIFDEHPAAVSGVCVVFEGTGFFAAAVGSVATGIMFLSGRNMPFKVSNSLPEGVIFLGRHLPDPDFSVLACLSAVERLRRRMHGRPSFLPEAEPLTPRGGSSGPPSANYAGNIAGGRRLV